MWLLDASVCDGGVPCLAERTPVRALLLDFPDNLKLFLLSNAVCKNKYTHLYQLSSLTLFGTVKRHWLEFNVIAMQC
jgi:hypothetical protein